MDKNKRICCFCERWESGGIESFLFNVLTRMDLQHLEIDIVASSIGRSIFTKFLQKNGIHFIELSGSQRNILENHRKFRKLLRERKYDILHLNAFQGLSLAYLCIAKQESVPVRIAHSHNSALRESPFRSLKLMIHTWARARYTKDATNLWTCSRMASEFMFNKCRGVTQRIEFIPNGIDTARFRFDLKARIKERVRLDFGNDLVIGSVGRFCYQKNQSFLIEIFNEVLKHRPDSRLLLVGEGESRDVLIDKVQQLGLEDTPNNGPIKVAVTFAYVSSGGGDHGGGGGGGGGGGSSSSSSRVTVASTTHGRVTVSPDNPKTGDTVTITVRPDDGYVLDTLTVTNASGKEVELTKVNDTRYTFVMPSSKVTVKATFVAEEPSGMPFTDVASGAWYYDAVSFVYKRGLMAGTGDNLFSPNVTTSRGMIVTILYRLDGSPSASSAGFTDVASGQWYTDAVNWAAANDIVAGYGNGLFGPNDTVTREQMAVILYRYAQYKGYDTSASNSLNGYTDVGGVSSWALTAMQWANAEGLINGTSSTTLSPTSGATRAEVAQILMRFCENFVD